MTDSGNCKIINCHSRQICNICKRLARLEEDIPTVLDDLDDVNAPNPTEGECLCFNGEEWVPTAINTIKLPAGEDLQEGDVVQIVVGGEVKKLLTPQWKWVQNGTNSSVELSDISVGDGAYVTGRYFNTATFFGETNEMTLEKINTGDDIFIVKYTLDGDVEWAVGAGGTETDQGYGIAVQDAVYITGRYENVATFFSTDDTEVTLEQIEGSSNSNIFVTKYTLDGTVEWAVGAGGTGFDLGYEIAVDDAIYITGEYRNVATFFSTDDTEVTLEQIGDSSDSNIFVAKYTLDGTVEWAVRAGGNNNFDIGYGIAVEDAVYITGRYQAAATFFSTDDTEVTLDQIETSFNDNIFVAKYTLDGIVEWAVGAGGTGFDRGHGIAVDDAIYITGEYRNVATFFSTDNTEVTLEEFGLSDIFVAKYTLDGIVEWAVRAGGTDADIGYGITVDDFVYVTGYFENTAIFEGTNNTEVILEGNDRNIFIAKYTLNGEIEWAMKTTVNGTSDSGFGIDVKDGNIYVTGNQLEATFFELDDTPFKTLEPDIYIGKLNNTPVNLPGLVSNNPSEGEDACVTFSGQFCYPTLDPLIPGQEYYLLLDTMTGRYTLTTTPTDNFFGVAIAADKIFIKSN